MLDGTSIEPSIIIGVLCEVMLQSPASIIPLPILLPLRQEGVTASAQIFTQTLPSSPGLRLSAARVVMHIRKMRRMSECELYSEVRSLVTQECLSVLATEGSLSPNKLKFMLCYEWRKKAAKHSFWRACTTRAEQYNIPVQKHGGNRVEDQI